MEILISFIMRNSKKEESNIMRKACNVIFNHVQTYLLYLWKQIRDSKIRTKLYIFLISMTIICGIIIGGVSYFSMKNALIENAQETAVSLIKRTGSTLDEKIKEFQDASFTLINKDEIQTILRKEQAGNVWNHNLDEYTFNNNMFFYNSLYKNSDFAILEANNGEVYLYNQVGKEKGIDADSAKEVLDSVRNEVSVTKTIKWVKKEKKVYFVRKVTENRSGQKAKEIGMLVFAVKPTLFECGDDSNPYICNENIMVADPNHNIFENDNEKLSKANVDAYLSYNEGKYYVYTTTSRVEREQHLVIALRTEKYQWNVLCFIPYALILEKANRVVIQIFITTILFLCLGVLVANLIQQLIRKNLQIIESGIKQYERGDYSRLESPACYDEIGMTILEFNHMGMKINELNELARKEQEEKQNLQYQVMEAQINPHFLYNTLGSLKWLAYEKEEEEIAKLADAIIELLRFSVKHVNKMITLQEEICYINQYIYIQKMRYDNAFCVEMEVTKEAEGFRMIGFILQPFVENSILHGLDTSKQDGLIKIKGSIVKDGLQITIEDNGFGMDQETLNTLVTKIERNHIEEYKGFNGIGVTNIILRLKLLYGEAFHYKIESALQKGTMVTLVIPGEEKLDEEKSFNCRR